MAAAKYVQGYEHGRIRGDVMPNPPCFSCEKRPATTTGIERTTGITRHLCQPCRWVGPVEADAMDVLTDAFEAQGWTVELGYGSAGMFGVMLSLSGEYDRSVDTSAVYYLAHGYSGEWGLCRYANVDDLGYDRPQWCDNNLAPQPSPITSENIGAAALVTRVDEVIAHEEQKRDAQS